MRCPREGVHDLLSEPLGRGVRGHVDEDQTSTFQAQDDEDVEDLEPDGGNDEHVDGDDVAGVVLEEGCPRLRPGLGRLGPDAGQIARDRARADDVAESFRSSP